MRTKGGHPSTRSAMPESPLPLRDERVNVKIMQTITQRVTK
jgi:hypothetical protein